MSATPVHGAAGVKRARRYWSSEVAWWPVKTSPKGGIEEPPWVATGWMPERMTWIAPGVARRSVEEVPRSSA